MAVAWIKIAKDWLLKHGAPEGIAPRGLSGRLKHYIKVAIIEPVMARAGGWADTAYPPLPLDRTLDDLLLRWGASSVTWSATDAEQSELGAARLIMGLLRDRPELRKAFPQALSEGTNGSFCLWLCSGAGRKLGLNAQGKDNIRAAFSRELGSRIRRIYDHDSHLRKRIPLALTPAGQRPFLAWLLLCGRAKHGLSIEEILWFLFEASEDPSCGIAPTYLRTPVWQKKFPPASEFAPKDLLAWIARSYGIHDEWLASAAFALPRTPDTAGVNVLGHFCYPSGLGEAVHFMTRALSRAGMHVSGRDVPTHVNNDTGERSAYLGLELFDCTVIAVPPDPNLDSCFPQSGLAPAAGKHRIGVWYCELETAPASWSRHARLLQEIWAPTRFIARALRPVMPIPVVDMLPGVELGPIPSLGRGHFGLPGDRFLFLFMFDMWSVMERKNPLALIRAFRKAFRPDEPADLIIKVARGHLEPANLAALRRAAAEAGVQVIDAVMSRGESYALMNACDCYVSLHRSEGFGLTLAEAMLMGKPVIATGYSGNLDFMTPGNSLLVDFERVRNPRALPNYPRGAVWAEPSVDQAAIHLRWLYEHRAQGRDIGMRGRADAGRLLSLEAAGQRMARRLETIRGASPAKALAA